MLKRLILLGLATWITLNTANSQLMLNRCVEGIIGRGELLTERPMRVKFDTEVYHYFSDVPWGLPDWLRGYFKLEAGNVPLGELGYVSVSIKTIEIRYFYTEQSENGRVARYAGPAVAHIHLDNSTIEVYGELIVSALDGESLCRDCPSDFLKISFVPISIDLDIGNIAFNGFVNPRTGGLRIFYRCRW